MNANTTRSRRAAAVLAAAFVLVGVLVVKSGWSDAATSTTSSAATTVPANPLGDAPESRTIAVPANAEEWRTKVSTTLIGPEDPMLVQAAGAVERPVPPTPEPLPLHPEASKVEAPAAGTPAAELSSAAPEPPTPNAEHLGVDVMNDRMFAVMYRLPGPFKEWCPRYKASLIADGWTIKDAFDLDIQCSIRATKGDLESGVYANKNAFGNEVDNVYITVTRKA